MSDVRQVGGTATTPAGAGGTSAAERVRVPVILSSKHARPAEEANALLKSLKYSERRIAAYNQKNGGDVRQDAPPATDTAEKTKQPEIKVGPDEMSLERAQPQAPTTTSQPTSNQPAVPRGQPQSEPPSGKPPLDPSKFVVPAVGIGTAVAGITGSKMMQPSRTEPSGEGQLTGRPERIRPNDDEATRQAKEAENRTAQVLVDTGYKVEHGTTITADDVAQNPALKVGRRPDYRIEGELFDCYSPERDTSAVNIAGNLDGKVAKGQATRFVVNLDANDVSIDELKQVLGKKQAGDKPIRGLQEIILVKGDKVTSFFPFE